MNCKNCGHPVGDTYCSHCGEKVYSEKDKKLSHLLEEVFHFLTHFEGTFFTSLKTMFARPGKVSLDYTNGIRKKYFKPVSFMLMLIILYLVFPRFQGLNMRFEMYTFEGSQYYWLAVPLARKKMAAHGISLNELGALYDARSATYAKIMLLLIIPITAFVLRLINYKRKKFFFDHFIIATELLSMYLLVLFLLLPHFLLAAATILPMVKAFKPESMAVSVSVLLWMFVYTALTLRRFYELTLIKAIIRTLLFLTIFVSVIMYVYKALLFQAVMFSL